MTEPDHLQQIALILQRLGCPPEKTDEMARMLDKRAHQLAEGKGRTYEEAMAHLIGLMQKGWAAPPNS